MIRRFITAMALLALLGQSASALSTAASSEALDGDLVDDAAAGASAPAVNAAPAVVSAPAMPRTAPAAEPTVSANPLWAIPLARLSGTRDRPIFSPSRRPPAALAAEPVVAKAPARRRAAEPPSLALVGTIAGDAEGFGIFLDRSTKAALRLKVGDDYQGWKLLMIRGRDVTMAKDQQAAVLSLPQPGTGQAFGEIHLLPVNTVAAAPGR